MNGDVKVFLTGATGFVGLNIVSALLAAGYEVHAYVRRSSRTTYLDRFPVHRHVGELSDPSALLEAMTGCRYVIHTAGNTSCDTRDMEALLATNVRSTENVIEAARCNGIKRIVFTSTTSTIGALDDPHQRHDETTPLTGFRSHSPYARTKQLAEQKLFAAQAAGIEVIVLNPAEIIGPLDHNLQWGRIVIATAAGRLPFVPPGSGSFCAAQDVGQAHVSALTQGRSGERYILAGHDVPFRKIIESAAAVAGVEPRPLNRMPYPLQRLAAAVRERLWWLWPGRSAVDSYRMRVFGGHYLFDSGKAERELGYRSRPIEEMVHDCYAWYRENRLI
jgi:dihydroflavonol-4-reductase